MPTVRPRRSIGRICLRGQRPARVETSATTIWRVTASSSAIVCSAAEMAFAPGALSTSTPGPGGGLEVDIVDADPGAGDDAQVGRGGEDLFGDLGLAADDERVGVAHGVEQRRDIQAVDVDDPRRGGEAIARGGMNGVADDDQRAGFRPVGLERRRGSV